MATSLFPRAAWLALAVTAGDATPAEAGGKTPGKNAKWSTVKAKRQNTHMWACG